MPWKTLSSKNGSSGSNNDLTSISPDIKRGSRVSRRLLVLEFSFSIRALNTGLIHPLQISPGILFHCSLLEKMLIGGFGIGPFAKDFIADSNVIRCCKGCRVIVL